MISRLRLGVGSAFAVLALGTAALAVAPTATTTIPVHNDATDTAFDFKVDPSQPVGGLPLAKVRIPSGGTIDDKPIVDARRPTGPMTRHGFADTSKGATSSITWTVTLQCPPAGGPTPGPTTTATVFATFTGTGTGITFTSGTVTVNSTSGPLKEVTDDTVSRGKK
ncbi:MAG: hypothetical protein L0216_09545 [Planctomycetales bacterium]|nr:hypothetical protein [Planctomycetales bacterium]